MNPLKRKYEENVVELNTPSNKHFKPENIFLFLPLEIFIKIGEHLSDRSKAHYTSLSKEQVTHFSPGFWDYIESRRGFRLEDFQKFSPKIRYFLEHKLLTFMTSAREAPNKAASQREFKTWCRSLEQKDYPDEIHQAHLELMQIFLWSINCRTSGCAALPESLHSIRSRVHREDSTPSENLIAGWIAAHTTRSIAKEYLVEAFQPKVKDGASVQGIMEAACIPCLFPLVCDTGTRNNLIQKAAENGLFLPLERLLFESTYNKDLYKQFMDIASGAAWKAMHRQKNNLDAREFFDTALILYTQYTNISSGRFGPVPLKVLKKAIQAYDNKVQCNTVIEIYKAIVESCIEKNKSIPKAALFHTAWAYAFAKEYTKSIELGLQWLEAPGKKEADQLKSINYILCFSHFCLGNVKEALPFGEKCLENELKASWHSLVGDVHFALRNFISALGLYNKARETSPTPALYLAIAQCYKQLGDPENSIDSLHRAVEIGRTSQTVPREAFLELALALQTKGENQNALLFYHQANITTTETPVEYLLSYARAAIAIPQILSALQAYNIALLAIKNQGLLPSLADEIYKFIYSQEWASHPVEALPILYTICNFLNQFRSVESIFLQLFNSINGEKHFVHKAKVAELLFYIYFFQKDIDLAKQYFDISYQIFKQENMEPFYYARALEVHYALGIYEEAVKFYDQATQRAIDSPTAFPSSFYICAANAQMALGSMSRGLAILHAALDYDQAHNLSTPEEIYAVLASAYIAESNEEKGVEYLAKVNNLSTVNCPVLEKAASHCNKTVQTSLAVHLYFNILSRYLEKSLPIPGFLRDEIQELQCRLNIESLSDLLLERLAMIQEMLGNLDNANSLYEQIMLAQRSSPSTLEQILAKAINIYAKLGDEKSIRQSTEQFLERGQPAHPLLHIACSRANFELGNFHEAAQIADLRIAQAENIPMQNLAVLYILSGDSYFELGNYAKAAERYNYSRVAFRLLPVKLLLKIAKLNLQLEYVNEAIYCYKDICQSMSQIPNEILNDLNEITSKYSIYSAKALFYLNVSYSLLNQHKQSIHFGKKFILSRSKPSNITPILTNLEDSYMKLGKLEKFLIYLQERKDAEGQEPDFELVNIFEMAEASARAKLQSKQS